MHPPGLRYGLLLERVDDRFLVGLIAVVALVNALLWAFTIPFNEAPDEAAHFQVVRFILDHGRLPLFSPDELWLHSTSKGFVESYAPFPPLATPTVCLALPQCGDTDENGDGQTGDLS